MRKPRHTTKCKHTAKNHYKNKKDPYPHPDKWVRLLDKIVLAAGVLGPVMTLPQIMLIYGMKSAAGLSLISWGLYAFFDVFWIIYGIVHRERPIMIAYILWFTVNMCVVAGILMYPA